MDIVVDKLSKAIAIYLAHSGDYSVVDKLAHASKVEDVLEALNNVLREMPSAINNIRSRRSLAFDKIDKEFLSGLLEQLARPEYDLSRDIQLLYEELRANPSKIRLYGLRLSSHSLGYLSTALIRYSRER